MPRHHRKVAWAEPAFFEVVFDIHRNSLKDREVERRDVDGRDEYEIGDFYRKCADLLLKRMLAADGMDADNETGLTPAQLKSAKTREEVRRLRLQNDAEEKLFVRKTDVLPTYMRGMKKIVEKLDRIPTRIKMKAPDISSAILAVITDCIAEARNEAAKEPPEL